MLNTLMTDLVVRTARIALVLVVAAVLVVPANAASVSVIPQPAEMRVGEGTLRIAADAAIIATREDAKARRVANWLRAEIGRTYGLPLTIGAKNSSSGVIVLALDANAPVSQPEGYSLDIGAQSARITARDEAGLFYGAVTLWQLLASTDNTLTLPVVAIRDWPRFAWRGLMLDVARHYVPTQTIKSLLDAMSVHKLNVFHWHLTDDQGWRLQIRRYPQLTDIGAWRTSPVLSADNRAQRYGGYYTQEEVREIVAYAAARNIAVVPELDMPGHAQAVIAAMPQIGVTGTRPPVAVDWGINPYLFGVHEESLAFIRNVLDEVLELFPSTFIHVGGDEAIKDQWQASSAVQARMRALGIENEHKLQTWFIEQVGHYLSAHQRRLIGWDEILEGGIPRNASVMSWRGIQGAIDAAKLGHDVVLSPAPTLYLDNLESRRGDEPAGRMAVRTLENVYHFEPVPTELSPLEARHVLGAQANLWTEYKTSPRHIELAAFPRALALAEVDWSPRATRDWKSFLGRMPAALARLRRLSLSYSDTAFASNIDLDMSRADALAAGTARVKLTTQAGFGTLRYTLDGTAPTSKSNAYEGVFAVKLPVTIVANTFGAEGPPLAAPRSRRFDTDTLLSWDNSELAACPKGDLGLRTPLDPDSQALAPVYNVNLFDACWSLLQAPLTGMKHITVEAASLARNYGLAHDADKVVIHPARTEFGELQVHADHCDGPLLADMPLHGTTAGRVYELSADLSPFPGVHDLCLRFTGAKSLPMPAIGRVQLRR